LWISHIAWMTHQIHAQGPQRIFERSLSGSDIPTGDKQIQV